MTTSATSVTDIRKRRTLDDRGRTASIDKALILYETLRSSGAAMRLSDLSRRTGLPKSTTHRLLNALLTSGMVVRFGVGYEAVDRPVDPVPAARRDLLRRLAPFVGDLLIRTRLTSSLAMLEDTDVVFSHRAYGHDAVWTPSDDSGRDRAYRTAAGRLLLSDDLQAACDAAEAWGLAPDAAAHLNRDLVRIKQRRFAIAARAGITCLAVALPIGPGHPQVAFTVKGQTSLIDQDRTLFALRKVAYSAARAVLDATSTMCP